MQTAGDGGGAVNGPVFYDDSGVRVVAWQWSARASILVGGLLCLAVMAALGTHVSLPGLNRLNPFVSLSQRPDASRSPERREAIEPLPAPILREDDRRAGPGRAAAVTPESNSPAKQATAPATERAAAVLTGEKSARAVAAPSKTDREAAQQPEPTPSGRNPITGPPGLRGQGHPVGSKAKAKAKALERSGKPSAHSAGRAAAEKPKPGQQPHTGPAKGVGLAKAATREAEPVSVKP